MKKIKEAFEKVKNDIFNLGTSIQEIKLELLDLKQDIARIIKDLDKTKEESLFSNQNSIQKQQENQENTIMTHKIEIPAHQHINPTHLDEIPADKLLSQVLKRQKLTISTGNVGVPTDRQTDQQTDKNNQILTSKLSQNRYFYTGNEGVNNNLIREKAEISDFNQFLAKNEEKQEKTESKEEIKNINSILSSLDNIKKQLRRKFKNLTKQEFLIFSTIYSLGEQEKVDYPLLAQKLKISESSVRDYIQKIIKKGIPINKTKINNKKILLSVSPELKKIASLDTIIKLKEI